MKMGNVLFATAAVSVVGIGLAGATERLRVMSGRQDAIPSHHATLARIGAGIGLLAGISEMASYGAPGPGLIAFPAIGYLLGTGLGVVYDGIENAFSAARHASRASISPAAA